ncbi:transporter substrate-binding domain-containing protein [Zavarzinia compransoris]|uniref:transporter substrate-binding domain-containing protein n=1 Tax=Zavarzinia marina TaxID=2911065 RepID=UPI001F19C256|nr:transporter substrate-binding domain-containing protein [Zavarzinia marina]MCF4166772.1 transporter substrate-binding domain-containing protein [Zavarzinia marina]
MMKRLLALGTAAALALGLAVPAAASQLDDILEKKKITIAVPQDFAPFGSVGPDLQPEGYDIDVAKLIAENMGVEVELVPVSSANRIPYLQTGKVDLVISSMGATPERAKAIWFTAAYAPFFSAAYGADDLAVSSVADLAGKSVGVTRGSVEDIEISRLVSEDADVKRYEDNGTTIAAYLSGQVDVLVTGNVVAAKIAKDMPDAQVSRKFVLRNSPCFIGLKKGDVDLLQWLNVFIMQKKINGELDALAVKWFGETLPDLPTL